MSLDVRALTVSLARHACEVDDVVQALAGGPLTEEHELLLAAPTAHLAMALEALTQIAYELDRHGLSPFISEVDRVAA